MTYVGFSTSLDIKTNEFSKYFMINSFSYSKCYYEDISTNFSFIILFILKSKFFIIEDSFLFLAENALIKVLDSNKAYILIEFL